jgi:hypothetical protein
MSEEIDIQQRFDRAHELRVAVHEPAALVEWAQHLLVATPPGCDVLVAFSPEGHAIGAAASALAHEQGRVLALDRASHIAPLAPGTRPSGWRWINVEEALGLGRVRPWVGKWARERGAGEPTEPAQPTTLAQVA